MLRIFRSSFALSTTQVQRNFVQCRGFHASGVNRGLEEFFDKKNPGEMLPTGRGWTVTDLRRKVSRLWFNKLLFLQRSSAQSFEDLHKLYYVLYKERNLLLTDKEKARKLQRPYTAMEERRYNFVKRGMAGIKVVVGERKRLNPQIEQENASASDDK